MAILTDEERKMIDEGKISYTELIRQRAIENKDKHSINHNALDEIKQKIRDANVRYKEAIQRNKDLYTEIEASRKAKEVCRNEIAALRIEKKKILGIYVKDIKKDSELTDDIENINESQKNKEEIDKISDAKDNE